MSVIYKSKVLAQEQGIRLKYVREITGLSRRAFGLKYGTSPGTLQNVEDGRYKRGITEKFGMKLINMFRTEGIEVNLDWLLYGEGPEPKHHFWHIKETTSLSRTQENANEELNEINLLQQTIENEKRYKLNTELFSAAANGRHKEVVRLINTGVDAHLYQGLKVKPYEKEHNTPLHLAALNGYLEIVKYLIKKEADIDAKNRKNQTPLHLAVHNAHKHIIEYLVESGADINAPEDEGDTPLAWAAYKGQTEVVSLLIKLGANIHEQNKTGNTPLHWAAEKGYLDIVELLILQDANLQLANFENKIPLMLAVQNGHTDTVKLMLSHLKKSQPRQ